MLDLSEQTKKFPSTRYMGSKRKLLREIWTAASQFNIESVADVFAGSQVVSYMFKAQGKQVFTNDYMAFSANLGKALIENNTDKLSEKDIDFLLQETDTDKFVENTFSGIYFSDEDNQFIDKLRTNIKKLEEHKKSLAMATLIRACTKKRARGIFTYTGLRYDDGRRDLKLSLQEQFLEAVNQMNQAVFDNGQVNVSSSVDALQFHPGKVDLAYFDPPYYSPLSDNEYVRRYHFIEGLARDWQGVEIQENTKTKKFKSYPTPFSTRAGAIQAFDALFNAYKESILIVSYSSNSQPSQEEIVELMSKYKKHVEVVNIDHRYSFGNQAHKIDTNKNAVKEYLFIGHS